jgi:hypothetical protein
VPFIEQWFWSLIDLSNDCGDEGVSQLDEHFEQLNLIDTHYIIVRNEVVSYVKLFDISHSSKGNFKFLGPLGEFLMVGIVLIVIMLIWLDVCVISTFISRVSTPARR